MRENYFEIPNTENCYYAGFIAGDGCICDTEKWGQKFLQLMITDKEPIFDLHNKLQLSNKISVGFPKNKKPIYKLKAYSNKICNDLFKNWNITPRKTNTLMPPNLKDLEFIKSYLIGLIDADGCISYEKNKNYFRLRITGNSESLLDWCKKYLAKIGQVNERPKLQTCNKNSLQVSYDSRKARHILINLKDHEVPKLLRKWGKVNDLS